MIFKVCNMARCSSKSGINSIGCRARNVTIKKWEIENFKIVRFIVIFGRNNPYIRTLKTNSVFVVFLKDRNCNQPLKVSTKASLE